MKVFIITESCTSKSQKNYIKNNLSPVSVLFQDRFLGVCDSIESAQKYVDYLSKSLIDKESHRMDFENVICDLNKGFETKISTIHFYYKRNDYSTIYEFHILEKEVYNGEDHPYCF